MRVVPTLLFKDFGLVKGVGFDGRRGVGTPMQAIKVYEMRGVDELVFLDVAATPNGSGPDVDLIDELADECFMPLTVGGGVRSVEDVARVLEVGADKVCIGTAAIENPGFVEAAASRFGSQSIVVSIDTYRSDAGLEVRTHCGTQRSVGRLETVARQMEAAGAGELLVQSVDRDGTMSGYDLETLALVADATDLPMIASGGAGSYEDMLDALMVPGVRAVAAASMFHFTERTPSGAKDAMASAGFPVRR